MTKLLAIDTSTNYLSLAITDGDKVIARFHKRADMSHSSLLVPMIDRLVKKARLKLKDIDGFSVSIGPGSFTGLRIGVTTVKTLAYALTKPIVAVPTLDVIANNIKDCTGLVCPVLDARKNKVYACLYKAKNGKLKRISKNLLLPAVDLVKMIKDKRILFLGDGVDETKRQRYKETKIIDYAKDWHPRAEVVARLGLEYFKKKKFVRPENLEPMYVYSRECDITGV